MSPCTGPRLIYGREGAGFGGWCACGFDSGYRPTRAEAEQLLRDHKAPDEAVADANLEAVLGADELARRLEGLS